MIWYNFRLAPHRVLLCEQRQTVLFQFLEFRSINPVSLFIKWMTEFKIHDLIIICLCRHLYDSWSHAHSIILGLISQSQAYVLLFPLPSRQSPLFSSQFLLGVVQLASNALIRLQAMPWAYLQLQFSIVKLWLPPLSNVCAPLFQLWNSNVSVFLSSLISI